MPIYKAKRPAEPLMRWLGVLLEATCSGQLLLTRQTIYWTPTAPPILPIIKLTNSSTVIFWPLKST